MGQIAEDMIEGFCCSLCSVYFAEEHGYPVACNECWENNCGFERATNEEL